MNKTKYLFLLLTLAILAGCNKSNKPNREDKQAKQMLQGMWVTYDSSDPAFMAKGDSIFYPDSTSLPVSFWIEGDSLFLQGARLSHYFIIKQAPHLLKIENQTGDSVTLVKSNDKALRPLFAQNRPYALNTFRTYDADTTTNTSYGYFTCKIHVETTSDRVVKSVYNDQGVEVDNMYLDNLARLNVLSAGKLVYSHNFRKQEFSQFVPQELFKKSILRGMEFSQIGRAHV